VSIPHFDYNDYHPSDQNVGEWISSICKAQVAYNFGHDVIESIMREQHVDRPTAVRLFHQAVVLQRLKREAILRLLEDFVDGMDRLD